MLALCAVVLALCAVVLALFAVVLALPAATVPTDRCGNYRCVR